MCKQYSLQLYSPGAGDVGLRHLHASHQLRHGGLKHGGHCAMLSCLKIIHFVCCVSSKNEDWTYFYPTTGCIYKHFACHFTLVICCPNRNQFRRYTLVIKICPIGLTIHCIDIFNIVFGAVSLLYNHFLGCFTPLGG